MNGITPAALEKYMHELLPARLGVVEEMEKLAERDRIRSLDPSSGACFFSWQRW